MLQGKMALCLAPVSWAAATENRGSMKVLCLEGENLTSSEYLLVAKHP